MCFFFRNQNKMEKKNLLLAVRGSFPLNLPARRPPETPAMGARHIGAVTLKAFVKGVEITIIATILYCLFVEV